MLGGQVSVGINGLAEFAAQIDAGALRVLAVSSARAPARHRRTDACASAASTSSSRTGAPLVAPPGLTAEERARLARRRRGDGRARPNGASCSTRFRWLDRYLAGDEFAAFAAAEERRVRAILRELGTARRPARVRPLSALRARRARRCSAPRRPSTLRRERRAEPQRRSSTGARSASSARAPRCTCCSPRRAGFIVAAALLFWLIARAFDARHPLRDAACALGVAVASYALFDYALDLPLPAGALGAWL